MSTLTEDRFASLYLASADKSLPGFDSLYRVFTAESTVERLYKITDILIDNGKRFNLTSILDPAEIIRKHIIDSLIPLGLMYSRGVLTPNQGRERLDVCDVGVGGGFPSLPMAAAAMSVYEDGFADGGIRDSFGRLVFTGVDSTAKKINHVISAAEYAELDNYRAAVSRAEELSLTKSREKYDIVTARALAPLPVLLELCLPLTKVGGYFCALKGHAEEEIAAAGKSPEKLGASLAFTERYNIPGGDGRELLIYKKISETPPSYPRRYAEITKHPLS